MAVTLVEVLGRQTDRQYAARVLGIYLLTYLLTPCSTVLLDKLTGFQPVKKFPALYGT